MTAGEPCVGALGTAVGALNGPEQLLLQAISLLIVQLLVRCGQRRECAGEVIDRLAERVEELLARFYGGVGHPGSSLVLRESPFAPHGSALDCCSSAMALEPGQAGAMESLPSVPPVPELRPGAQRYGGVPP